MLLKVDKNTIVKVTNRSDGSVGYVIPDMNIKRTYYYRETKEVSAQEMDALSQTQGGRYLIENCLLIHNDELVKEILGKVEPEYNYDEKAVRNLLVNGSLDELLDCLDFAPTGVIDLVKRISVEIELNDIKKRQAILNKTGFNVTNAIDINKQSTEEEKAEAPAQRRVKPSSPQNESEGGTSRRTEPPKYKVVK